jgi:hypothetical protein
MKTIFTKLNRYFQGPWRLAVLHPLKGLWPLMPLLKAIPYLKAQNAHGCHILMQPLEPAAYLLADDLNWTTICSHHRSADGTWKPGRMVVQTSPANFQVWIHSQKPLSLAEKSFWLKKLRSDPAAHPHKRWGRCPGFRNRKEKYRTPEGQYPLAALIWVDWMRRADIPQIIPTKPPPPQDPLSHPSPRGAVCRHKSVSRRDYLRASESQTDFAYTLALARRGYSEQHIRERLLAERTSWENHMGGRRKDLYLDRTIRRAREIIAMTGNSDRLSADIGHSRFSSPCTSTDSLTNGHDKVQISTVSPE